MRSISFRRCVHSAVLAFFVSSTPLRAQQFLTDMMDTTTSMGRGMLSIFEKYNELRFSLYLQPQWQWAGSKGVSSFSGGDFAANSNNRFTMRRGRFRMDYVRLHPEGTPRLQFLLQMDASERGVFVRDAWGRVFENRWKLFSLTGGILARPFGYEINLGSADRESPERGRASQTLMRIERDAGAMITLEPRGKGPHWLRFDVGLFNGPGLPGLTDYDSRKDLIARLWRKPHVLNKQHWTLSGGLSGFWGGIESRSPVVYRADGGYMRRDSSSANQNTVQPRRYAGADVQFRIPNGSGSKRATEFRAEYLRGQQTATAATSETPGTYPLANGAPVPLYVRQFDAAYFYFLQHIGSPRHQVVLKYDWYDPARQVSGTAVDGTRAFTGADVRFNTLGGGYVFYANPNIKTTLWYDRVMNEHTAVNGFTGDVKDDVVTVRVQYRF